MCKKEQSGLRTFWQKFAILIPKTKRACLLAKKDESGSYVWATV